MNISLPAVQVRSRKVKSAGWDPNRGNVFGELLFRTQFGAMGLAHYAAFLSPPRVQRCSGMSTGAPIALLPLCRALYE